MPERGFPKPVPDKPKAHRHKVRLTLELSPGFWWALIGLALALVWAAR